MNAQQRCIATTSVSEARGVRVHSVEAVACQGYALQCPRRHRTNNSLTLRFCLRRQKNSPPPASARAPAIIAIVIGFWMLLRLSINVARRQRVKQQKRRASECVKDGGKGSGRKCGLPSQTVSPSDALSPGCFFLPAGHGTHSLLTTCSLIAQIFSTTTERNGQRLRNRHSLRPRTTAVHCAAEPKRNLPIHPVSGPYGRSPASFVDVPGHGLHVFALSTYSFSPHATCRTEVSTEKGRRGATYLSASAGSCSSRGRTRRRRNAP